MENQENSKLDEVRANAEEASENRSSNERAEVKAAAVEEKNLALSAAEADPGIQNTLEIIDFAVKLSAAIREAKANDGKIDLKDLPLIFPVAPLVIPMIDGITGVPKELGALDENEVSVLLARAAEIVGAQGPDVVLKVKAAIKWAHASYELYQAFAKKAA